MTCFWWGASGTGQRFASSPPASRRPPATAPGARPRRGERPPARAVSDAGYPVHLPRDEGARRPGREELPVLLRRHSPAGEEVPIVWRVGGRNLTRHRGRDAAPVRVLLALRV